jgi:hypothetical protein
VLLSYWPLLDDPSEDDELLDADELREGIGRLADTSIGADPIQAQRTIDHD